MLRRIEMLSFDKLPPLYEYLRHEAIAARFPDELSLEAERCRSKALALRESMIALHGKIKDTESLQGCVNLDEFFRKYCYDLNDWYDSGFDLCAALSDASVDVDLSELSLAKLKRKSWPYRHMIEGTELAHICSRHLAMCVEVSRGAGRMDYCGFSIGTLYDVQYKLPESSPMTKSGRRGRDVRTSKSIDLKTGKSIKHLLKESSYILYGLSAYLLSFLTHVIKPRLALYDGIDDLALVSILSDVEIVSQASERDFTNLVFDLSHANGRIDIVPRKRSRRPSRDELEAAMPSMAKAVQTGARTQFPFQPVSQQVCVLRR